MDNIKNLPVVILAGGLAKRMGGKEKALIEIQNRPLLSYILEIISGYASPIGLNINKNHKKFTKFKYPLLKDKIEGFLGPLSGIFTALSWAKDIDENWVLTLPCDTPYLPKNLIPKIMKLSSIEKNNFDVISVKCNHQTHPVIGLWKTNLIEKLENSLKDGVRKIDLFTSNMNVKYVEYFFKENSFDPFTNLNSPSDILNSQRILGYLPPFFGLAGWSGSGKTTLCTSLIKKLTDLGFNVACIKHAHHNFELDTPGKDSFKIRKSGAIPTIISSKTRFGLIYENTHENEKTLFELINIFSQSTFRKNDLLIVEGFKKEPIPKLEIYRHELNKPLLFSKDKNIFAVACDNKIKAKIPVLNLTNIQQISDFILNKFQLEKKNYE